MGKTAVFTLAVLQQLEPVENQVSCVVLGHTRELAYQIKHEFDRFSKYLPNVKTMVMYGGVPVATHRDALKAGAPNIIVGTPGRVMDLCEKKFLDLSHVKFFVLDECDKVLEPDMRKAVQKIFIATPTNKQVMMFTATLSKELRESAKNFMHDALEVFVDDDSKLTLHGLLQYYLKMQEREKIRKLSELLDSLEFNQVVIFVKSKERADALSGILKDSSFPAICIHGKMRQEDRIQKFTEFKNFQARILVSTDVFGRGIDIERVNIVINYDMPPDADSYLHRVGRAGRFGTKGLAVSFVTSEDENDMNVLNDVQSRFEVAISDLPESIDVTSYMTAERTERVLGEAEASRWGLIFGVVVVGVAKVLVDGAVLVCCEEHEHGALQLWLCAARHDSRHFAELAQLRGRPRRAKDRVHRARRGLCTRKLQRVPNPLALLSVLPLLLS
eukprot:CAMPEP_0185856628 /NCGR_PEP_ID=MMETSP1354-20130828/29096_1 /TAXON_ID=708628 /ORGANISM="Erythrolobus madagascarensis, Strain CCMP3276" /LENGTH=443 /DNA_ID=CAMNT_0028558889 /DNA_START=1106 /DNA_END=2435 /DNA_ORIENTATION=+